MKYKLAVIMRSDKPYLVGGKHIRPIEWRIMQTHDSYQQANDSGIALQSSNPDIQSYHIIEDDGR